jgi:hypothetical protein
MRKNIFQESASKQLLIILKEFVITSLIVQTSGVRYGAMKTRGAASRWHGKRLKHPNETET